MDDLVELLYDIFIEFPIELAGEVGGWRAVLLLAADLLSLAGAVMGIVLISNGRWEGWMLALGCIALCVLVIVWMMKLVRGRREA